MHVSAFSFVFQVDLMREKPVLLCRKSSGFSRGASIYRGVTRFIFLFHSWIKYHVWPLAWCLLKVFVLHAMQSCRHHQHGRWQARIGRVAGNKDLYLGTFSEYTPYEFHIICTWMRKHGSLTSKKKECIYTCHLLSSTASVLQSLDI